MVYNYIKTTNRKTIDNNYFSNTKQVRIKKTRIKLKNIDQFLNKVIYLINTTKEKPYINIPLPPKKSIKASVQKGCCINSSHSPNLNTVNTNKINSQKKAKNRPFNLKLTEGRWSRKRGLSMHNKVFSTTYEVVFGRFSSKSIQHCSNIVWFLVKLELMNL